MTTMGYLPYELYTLASLNYMLDKFVVACSDNMLLLATDCRQFDNSAEFFDFVVYVW